MPHHTTPQPQGGGGPYHPVRGGPGQATIIYNVNVYMHGRLQQRRVGVDAARVEGCARMGIGCELAAGEWLLLVRATPEARHQQLTLRAHVSDRLRTNPHNFH